LYSKEESYLWNNRKEILEAIEIIGSKDLYNPCPLLDNFIEFGKKREQKKDQKSILHLLDDPTENESNTQHLQPTSYPDYVSNAILYQTNNEEVHSDRGIENDKQG